MFSLSSYRIVRNILIGNEYSLIARMLVRQPENRATLEEIANDPWLKNTHSDMTAMPLISRQNISEEDHSIIVQKMVNGGIATKEQILE